MYANNGLYSPSIDCAHDSLLDDDVSATVVCTQCALVLQENYSPFFFCSPLPPPPSPPVPPPPPPQASSSNIREAPSAIFLKDLLRTWPHIDEGISDAIYSRYLIEREKIKERKKQIRLLAYLAYQELNTSGYSFLPVEIAQLFGLKTSDMFRFQSLLTNATSTTSPSISSMSDRYCSTMELAYKDKRNVGQICEALKLRCNTNPISLCVLVIWYYCSKHISLKHHSLQVIAKKCNCNYDNLKKLIKKPFWQALERDIDKMLEKNHRDC